MGNSRAATGLAAGILAIGTIASGAPAASAASGPVIVNCAGKGVSKPAQIVIACADAGVAITKITWSSWKASSAKGKGTLSWNPCIPDCLSSTPQSFPVRIALGGLASAPGQSDVFSKVSLTFTNGGPASLDGGTYVLDNKLS